MMAAAKVLRGGDHDRGKYCASRAKIDLGAFEYNRPRLPAGRERKGILEGRHPRARFRQQLPRAASLLAGLGHRGGGKKEGQGASAPSGPRSGAYPLGDLSAVSTRQLCHADPRRVCHWRRPLLAVSHSRTEKARACRASLLGVAAPRVMEGPHPSPTASRNSRAIFPEIYRATVAGGRAGRAPGTNVLERLGRTTPKSREQIPARKVLAAIALTPIVADGDVASAIVVAACWYSWLPQGGGGIRDHQGQAATDHPRP